MVVEGGIFVVASLSTLILLINILNAKRAVLGLCRCTLPSEDARDRTLGGFQVNWVPWIVLQPCKAPVPAECLKIFGSPDEGVDVMPAVALSLAHLPHEKLLLQAAVDRPAIQEARDYRRLRRRGNTDAQAHCFPVPEFLQESAGG